MVIAFIIEEVLAEQYGPYFKKEKSKNENPNANIRQVNNKWDTYGKKKGDENTTKEVCPKWKKTQHTRECMKGSG